MWVKGFRYFSSRAIIFYFLLGFVKLIAAATIEDRNPIHIDDDFSDISVLQSINQKFVIYRNANEHKCYVETTQKTNPDQQPYSRTLFVGDVQITFSHSIYKELGQDVLEFCRNNSIFTLEERLSNVKPKRNKRQVSQTRKPYFKGQTQTQFISFDNEGKGDKGGTAEAVAEQDKSRATVQGRLGMGQAQSQSGSGDPCEECAGSLRSGEKFGSTYPDTYSPTSQGAGIPQNRGGSLQPGLNAPGQYGGSFYPSLSTPTGSTSGGGPNQGGAAQSQPESSLQPGGSGISQVPIPSQSVGALAGGQNQAGSATYPSSSNGQPGTFGTQQGPIPSQATSVPGSQQTGPLYPQQSGYPSSQNGVGGYFPSQPYGPIQTGPAYSGPRGGVGVYPQGYGQGGGNGLNQASGLQHNEGQSRYIPQGGLTGNIQPETGLPVEGGLTYIPQQGYNPTGGPQEGTVRTLYPPGYASQTGTAGIGSGSGLHPTGYIPQSGTGPVSGTYPPGYISQPSTGPTRSQTEGIGYPSSSGYTPGVGLPQGGEPYHSYTPQSIPSYIQPGLGGLQGGGTLYPQQSGLQNSGTNVISGSGAPQNTGVLYPQQSYIPQGGNIGSSHPQQKYPLQHVDQGYGQSGSNQFQAGGVTYPQQSPLSSPDSHSAIPISPQQTYGSPNIVDSHKYSQQPQYFPPGGISSYPQSIGQTSHEGVGSQQSGLPVQGSAAYPPHTITSAPGGGIHPQTGATSTVGGGTFPQTGVASVPTGSTYPQTGVASLPGGPTYPQTGATSVPGGGTYPHPQAGTTPVLGGGSYPQTGATSVPGGGTYPHPQTGTTPVLGGGSYPQTGATSVPGGGTYPQTGATSVPGGGSYPQTGATSGSGGGSYPQTGATSVPGGGTYPQTGATSVPGGGSYPQTGATSGSGGGTYPQAGATSVPGGGTYPHLQAGTTPALGGGSYPQTGAISGSGGGTYPQAGITSVLPGGIHTQTQPGSFSTPGTRGGYQQPGISSIPGPGTNLPAQGGTYPQEGVQFPQTGVPIYQQPGSSTPHVGSIFPSQGSGSIYPQSGTAQNVRGIPYSPPPVSGYPLGTSFPTQGSPSGQPNINFPPGSTAYFPQPSTGYYPSQIPYIPGTGTSISGEQAPSTVLPSSTTNTGQIQGGSKGVDISSGSQITPIDTASGESQSLSSLNINPNETKAAASAQGKTRNGMAQAQVSGTYTGSFSAQAQTSDNEKSVQTQIFGNTTSASSSAEGKAGKSQSGSQIQYNYNTGASLAESQGSGINYHTNTQIQAGNRGGIADAQSTGSGSTSSQAQIGFLPFDPKRKDQTALFEGGGTSSSQNSASSGQSQTQLQGSFKSGTSFIGSAQSSAGKGQNRTKLAFDSSDLYLPAEDTSKQNISVDQNIKPTIKKDNNIVKSTVPLPSTPQNDQRDYTKDTFKDDDSPQHQDAVIQSKNYDAYIDRDSSDVRTTSFNSGDLVPGTNNYRIPSGFRGKVTSSAGDMTHATASSLGYAQTQTVSLKPGKGRVTINNRNRSDQQSFQNDANLINDKKNVFDEYVTVTKSETGELSGDKKFTHTYYTKSSTCGYFTFTCNYIDGSNGRTKICKPGPLTYSDGTPCR